MPLPVYVVSTGFNVKHRAVCLGSVKSQVGVNLIEHRWVDASEQETPLSCSENLRRLIADIPGDAIVAWLDLDDWMLYPKALARAVKEHEAGAWVTYGSFVHSSGQQVQIVPYAADQWDALRGAAWAASHLKTFRAGLFHRLRDDDLRLHGEEWLPHAIDTAIMLGVMEMAGPDRTVFVPQPLYVYSFEHSTDANADEATLKRQAECVRYVRGLKPYARIEAL